MLSGRLQGDGRRRGGPVGKLVQGVAAGIGLASESIHHLKEKKNAQKQHEEQQQQRTPSESSTHGEDEQDDSVQELSRQADEAAWQLDAAQDELWLTTPAGPSQPESAAALAEMFVHAHPLPDYLTGSNSLHPPRLALPVVITQRRPKSRSRGFIHAYAPLLQDVGIDQGTFLDFIDQLNQAVQPSPWIQAVNLAALAVTNVPEPVTILIGIAIKMAADAASELHSRGKTNTFLDRMNDVFFKPRGVIALVFTWKPSSPDRLTDADFDLGGKITQAAAAPESDKTMAKLARRMKSSSGTSAFEWPETAPLVFPALNDLAQAAATEPGGGPSSPAAKKESAIKRGGKFVQEYMDRRAQAKWSGESPDSAMANAAPKPEFHSRYADPNHPASSGDPLALLTGGYLQGGRKLTPLRSGVAGVGAGLLDGRARGRQKMLGGASVPGPGSLITGAKKLLQNDVLYLMIVNLPTQEEMARANAVLSQS